MNTLKRKLSCEKVDDLDLNLSLKTNERMKTKDDEVVDSSLSLSLFSPSSKEEGGGKKMKSCSLDLSL